MLILFYKALFFVISGVQPNKSLTALKRKKYVGSKKIFTLSPQTERLLEVVDLLQESGTIESDADLCRVLFYSPQSFNQIRKGRRNATVELITMFCFKFKVNPSYLILGQEPKLSFEDTIKKKIESSPKDVRGEENLITYIKDALKSSDFLKGLVGLRYWDERISYLVETIKQLETENVSKAYEIKTLNKVISDNLIKRQNVKHS